MLIIDDEDGLRVFQFDPAKFKKKYEFMGMTLNDSRWPWGMTPQRISQWKSGKITPNAINVAKIAVALRCPVLDLCSLVEGGRFRAN